MNSIRSAIPLFFVCLLATACAGPAADAPDIQGTIDASVRGTVTALASRTPISVLRTASQTPRPTDTSKPTQVPLTPTEVQPAQASVSLATNCRTGPGDAYARVFTLQPGKAADLLGRSSDGGYWYIANPDKADQACWLRGENVNVVGDVAFLPVITPEAPQAALVDFTLYRHSFSQCGPMRVSLVVVNNGRTTFRSARVQIRDITANNNIYGPNTDSSPFGDNPSSCPKDKGSGALSPGAAAYLVIPLNDIKAGNEAAAYVNLCTDDDGGGTCVTKSAYFRLPAD